MAEQPIPPSDLQARIERMKGKALFSEPKQIAENKILVHRCFSQVDGQSKPKSCSCKDRLVKSDAVSMITKGEADWLLVSNPNTPGMRPFHLSIVVRASTTAIAKAKTRRKEEFKLTKYSKAQEGIFSKFRIFAQQHFAAGSLPPTILRISDAALRAGLKDVEKLFAQFPELGEKHLRKMVTEFSVQLWNNVLIREGLPEDYRPYNKKAPKGRGKIITGEYDSNKLIQMDGFSLETAGETENLSLLGSLFRVRPEGSGPDQFESNETDAE